MTDVALTLSVDGETGALPAPVERGASRTLRIVATDRSTGAAVAATGVALVVRGPDGEETYSGGELTAGATGVWTCSITFDLAGVAAYVARASCTGPADARSADLPITVLGSVADTPLPAPPSPEEQEARLSADMAEQSAAEAAASAASALASAALLTTFRGFASLTAFLAALQAGQVSPSTVAAEMRGYAAAGDGGDQVWVRQAVGVATPGGHTAWATDPAAGGHFLLVRDYGPVNPAMFGCFGSPAGLTGLHATDDAPALQSMIDFVANSFDRASGSYGGSVLIAPRKYFIDSALVFVPNVSASMPIWRQGQPSGQLDPRRLAGFYVNVAAADGAKPLINSTVTDPSDTDYRNQRGRLIFMGNGSHTNLCAVRSTCGFVATRLDDRSERLGDQGVGFYLGDGTNANRGEGRMTGLTAIGFDVGFLAYNTLSWRYWDCNADCRTAVAASGGGAGMEWVGVAAQPLRFTGSAANRGFKSSVTTISKWTDPDTGADKPKLTLSLTPYTPAASIITQETDTEPPRPVQLSGITLNTGYASWCNPLAPEYDADRCQAVLDELGTETTVVWRRSNLRHVLRIRWNPDFAAVIVGTRTTSNVAYFSCLDTVYSAISAFTKQTLLDSGINVDFTQVTLAGIDTVTPTWDHVETGDFVMPCDMSVANQDSMLPAQRTSAVDLQKRALGCLPLYELFDNGVTMGFADIKTPSGWTTGRRDALLAALAGSHTIGDPKVYFDTANDRLKIGRYQRLLAALAWQDDMALATSVVATCEDQRIFCSLSKVTVRATSGGANVDAVLVTLQRRLLRPKCRKISGTEMVLDEVPWEDGFTTVSMALAHMPGVKDAFAFRLLLTSTTIMVRPKTKGHMGYFDIDGSGVYLIYATGEPPGGEIATSPDAPEDNLVTQGLAVGLRIRGQRHKIIGSLKACGRAAIVAQTSPEGVTIDGQLTGFLEGLTAVQGRVTIPDGASLNSGVGNVQNVRVYPRAKALCFGAAYSADTRFLGDGAATKVIAAPGSHVAEASAARVYADMIAGAAHRGRLPDAGLLGGVGTAWECDVGSGAFDLYPWPQSAPTRGGRLRLFPTTVPYGTANAQPSATLEAVAGGALTTGTWEFARLVMSGALNLRSYQLNALPALTSGDRALAFCSNLAGGAEPVFWDGTAWRRVSDRTVAS